MAILREVGGGFTAVCRSELAREKLTGTAFIQTTRVIVDAFREQARSYKGQDSLNLPPPTGVMRC